MPVPFNPRQLAKAVNAGYKSLANFRASTQWSLEQFVGPRYGKDPKKLGANKAAVVNLMNQAVSALLPNLVLMNPKTDIVARRVELSQHAKKLALAIDMVAQDQNLAGIYELIAQGALLGPLGTARIYVRQGVEVVKTEWGDTPCTDVGVDPIDIADFFTDPDCKRLDTARIDGHRWMASREILKESGFFDNAKLDQIDAMGKEDRKEDRISGTDAERWELFETIPLVDVAVYGAGGTRIVTLAGAKAGSEDIAHPDGKVVNEYEFEGLERGPYRHMMFTPLIGDNPMGLPPADVWGDIHTSMMAIARKIVRQILRTKRITISKRGQGGDDLDAVRAAEDGEHLELDDPSSMDTLEQGGVSRELYEGTAWLMSEFNNAGPNLSLIGGTPGAKEESATKTSILSTNSNQRLQYMQNKAFGFAGEVAEAIGFYLDTDPLLRALPIPVRAAGDEYVQVTFRPQGPESWYPGKYNFKIKQFSMVPMDPGIRSRRIIEILQTIPGLLPLEQFYPGVTSRALEALAADVGSEGLAEVLQDPQMLAGQQALLGAVPPGSMGVAQGQGMGGPAGMPMQAPGRGGTGGMTPGNGANPQMDQMRSAMAPAQVGV